MKFERRFASSWALNRPLPIQYLTFMRDFLTLQWGESLRSNTEIWPQVKKKLPITLELSVMTLLISIFMGIPLGSIMALKRDTWIDYSLRVFSLAGLSIPNFWTATMIVLGGAFFFNWSPRLEFVSPLEDPRGKLHHVLLARLGRRLGNPGGPRPG